MKLRRIETPSISHYAYVIADGDDAVVVDPRRDVGEYLEVARALGARVRYIIETHRQEDFELGSTHLAELTGAEVVNGRHDCFGRGDHRLADGDEIGFGGVTLRALHTPGHTPESMSYAVLIDGEAWAVLTGDALFYGETGRTDLPARDRQGENAALLYDMVHDKIAPLGDGVIVLPAHGPGSVCGSGMSSLPFSTIGTERKSNVVFTMSRGDFVAHKGSERLPRPPYFRHMEEVNLRGGRPLRRPPSAVPMLGPDALAAALRDATLIDTRSPESFAGGHIADAYSVWQGGLPVFSGWVAHDASAVALVGDDHSSLDESVSHLARIGIDAVAGGLSGGFSSWRDSGRPVRRCSTITPRELVERRREFTVLDVREADEVAAGHIPGALHAYVGHLEDTLPELDLPRGKPIVVTCGVGHRAGLAASMLLRAGFVQVYNLLGGMKAWGTLGLPTNEGDPS
ncbi:MAG TPA: rhodanese-like domain-containing protein [Polyangiaceae bacterium LLY-WYZ-14_1]|nr:rhodanese-like domain-containing protein [Polyangiaceae bacterium LLY-WYZ-14_1]